MAKKGADPLDEIEDSAVDDLMNTDDPETFKSALADFVRACMKREAKEEYDETDEEG